MMENRQWIDLRSDTVTRPTAEMRAAMASAEVGDDVYLEDPTVNLLQERAADILGKEASIFIPSGTMGNQIAIRVHTTPGQEVITEVRGHIFNYEMACMAAFSGVLARTIAAPDGIMNWEQIADALRGGAYYRAHTGLITLENTHNMAGGTTYTAQQTEEICRHAHERSLPVHLDGARIFNAAVSLGTTVGNLCAPADSVMFCLSKGLGAPVGSLLAGSRDFVEEARRVRKMLGGGMRQAGVLAAAGLIALEKMPLRLHEDHENALRLAKSLNNIGVLDLRPEKVRTNIVLVGIARTGLTASSLSAELRNRGLLVGLADEQTLRLLTHFDVSSTQIESVEGIFADTLRSVGRF